MKVQLVGCSHHQSSVEVRGRIAFNKLQAEQALDVLRERFPNSEAVLLSTCNRVELYTASEDHAAVPSHHAIAEFFADFHGVQVVEIFDELFERSGEDVVRHLFTVAASLDSMVIGEPQILAQVKQAYEMAQSCDSTGPLTHQMFQSALRVAKRVATETAINERRVSIPSVAVSDFAKNIFERFEDKQIVVIGAGEMGEETLRYLIDEGARDVTVLNRNLARAEALASKMNGAALPWERLDEALVSADLIVSTTGAEEPIVTLDRYRRIEPLRFQRDLFVLDLAVPRDFDPRIGQRLNVYLYSLDDLSAACERNRVARDKEWPKAMVIIEEETGRFMSDLHHRATSPIIRRARQGWLGWKDEELKRLFNRLGHLTDHDRDEIRQSFDRLMNKLLHPPLEALRDESRDGVPHGLIDAFKRLFNLKD